MSYTQAGQQLKQRMTVLIETLNQEIVDFMAREAEVDIKQNINERIGEKGLKGDDTGSFSPYKSKSHRRKRSKAGLSNSKKNFKFSGTMLNSVKVVKKTLGFGVARIAFGFTGTNPDANRKSSRGKLNSLIASYHGENEDVNMMQQTQKEKQELQRKLDNFARTKFRRVFT